MRNLLIMLDVNIHKQEKVEHTKGVLKSHKYLPFAQDMHASLRPWNNATIPTCVITIGWKLIMSNNYGVVCVCVSYCPSFSCKGPRRPSGRCRWFLTTSLIPVFIMTYVPILISTSKGATRHLPMAEGFQDQLVIPVRMFFLPLNLVVTV